MQVLMVLLLIFGIVVLMIAIIMGISYAVGTVLSAREGARVDASNKDPCAQCNAERDWYEALPPLKQNMVTVWWLVNRYLCSLKGCS